MRTLVAPSLVAIAALASLLPASCREAPDPSASGPSNAADPPRSEARDASASGVFDGPSQLCRDDRDCPIDERCCPAGLVGVCAPLDAASECAAPDLTLAFPPEFQPRFEHVPFDESDCRLQKCVGGPGSRRLLEFPLDVVNRGAGPAILALRDAPGVRRVACDGSMFLDEFLRYELVDAEGVRRAIGAGDVAVACQLSYMAESSSPFDCDTLGLEAQSYRAYTSDADCQWVDVTTLPPGQYTLRVSVNADGRLAEKDLGNNVLERTVVVPEADPLAPCEQEVPEDIGFGEAIECGWQLMPGQTGLTCTPGELISLACTFCDGAYVPRVCPGVEPCSAAGAVRYSSLGSLTRPCDSEHRCDVSGQCTYFPFACPASGRYTLLGFPTAPFLPSGSAPVSAPSAITCTDTEGARSPIEPAGDADEPASIGESERTAGDAGAAAP